MIDVMIVVSVPVRVGVNNSNPVNSVDMDIKSNTPEK